MSIADLAINSFCLAVIVATLWVRRVPKPLGDR